MLMPVLMVMLVLVLEEAAAVRERATSVWTQSRSPRRTVAASGNGEADGGARSREQPSAQPPPGRRERPERRKAARRKRGAESGVSRGTACGAQDGTATRGACVAQCAKSRGVGVWG